MTIEPTARKGRTKGVNFLNKVTDIATRLSIHKWPKRTYMLCSSQRVFFKMWIYAKLDYRVSLDRLPFIVPADHLAEKNGFRNRNLETDLTKGSWV